MSRTPGSAVGWIDPGRPVVARCRRSAGFTLLELVIVCLLIGLLLSVATPTMREALYSDALKSSARKVIGLVKGIRELAVREKQSYLLHVSSSRNQLWFEPEGETEKESNELDAEDDREDNRFVLPDDIRIAEVKVENDSSSSFDDIVVWISERGYMEELTIRLEDGGGGEVRVTFFPFVDHVMVANNESGL